MIALLVSRATLTARTYAASLHAGVLPSRTASLPASILAGYATTLPASANVPAAAFGRRPLPRIPLALLSGHSRPFSPTKIKQCTLSSV
jgi:hypothetical protein